MDDAPGMELRAGTKVRFARGTARKSPWCAREHRAIDWGVPLLLTEEFELVIMIEVAIEEMHGSDRYSDLKRITNEPGLVWPCLVGGQRFQRERNGALS